MALLDFKSNEEEGSHSGLGTFPLGLALPEIRKSRVYDCKARRIFLNSACELHQCSLMALLCQLCVP